jgi:hypothetical protein
MWREGGTIEQYTYHPDRPTKRWGRPGDRVKLTYPNGEEVTLKQGDWLTLRQYVKAGEPGSSRLIVWADGTKVLDENGFALRGYLQRLFAANFFGGADQSWAATQDEEIRFDDFKIWDLTNPE